MHKRRDVKREHKQVKELNKDQIAMSIGERFKMLKENQKPEQNYVQSVDVKPIKYEISFNILVIT